MKDTKKTSKPKTKKAPKVVAKEEVKETLETMEAASLAKNVAETAAKEVEQSKEKEVTLWIKRKTTPGQADSTWKIRGMFTSKKEAEKAFEKLNGTSDLYEHKFE